MKINKAKLIVGTLAIAATAATVGSISGTVAWFQYSTRSTAAYVGTSAKCSETLQIRFLDDSTTSYKSTNSVWHSDLTSTDVTAYLAERATASEKGTGTSIAPVTFGGVAKDAALPTAAPFASGPKANPIYQFFDYANWEDAAASDYVVIPLQLRLNDINGASGVIAGKEIYLADVTIQKKSTDSAHEDLSEGLRVHFGSTNNMLFGKDSANTTKALSTSTYDYLDLNGDGRYDKTMGYEWDTTTMTKYGAEGTQTAYNTAATKGTEGVNPMVNDNNAKLVTTNGIALGTTDSNGLLNVTVTIWLEGWAQLNPAAAYIDSTHTKAEIDALESPAIGDTYKPSDESKIYRYNGEAFEELKKESVWNAANYIGAQFQVGMRFVVDAL